MNAVVGGGQGRGTLVRDNNNRAEGFATFCSSKQVHRHQHSYRQVSLRDTGLYNNSRVYTEEVRKRRCLTGLDSFFVSG